MPNIVSEVIYTLRTMHKRQYLMQGVSLGVGPPRNRAPYQRGESQNTHLTKYPPFSSESASKQTLPEDQCNLACFIN
eukprot:4577134-Pyramimonas_sp.AAC.1